MWNKIGAAFAIVIVSLVVVEVVVRAINTIYPLTLPSHLKHSVRIQWLEGRDWRDGENRLYVLQPDSVGKTYGHEVRANSWGFREREFVERDGEGSQTFRIMVLGDSITMGFAIAEEDRYTNILEVKLRGKYPDRKIEVLNLGIIGFETVQEEKILRRMWKIIHPDLTVVGFYRNDPNVSYKYYLPYKIAVPLAIEPLLQRLIIFRMVEPVYDRWYRKLQGIPTHCEEADRAFNRDSNEWELFEGSVERMAAFVLSNTGRSPMVLYLADEEMAKNKQHYQQVRKTFEKNGFIWVESESGKYIPISRFERHPNEEANRHFAQVLFDKIVELDMIRQVMDGSSLNRKVTPVVTSTR